MTAQKYLEDLTRGVINTAELEVKAVRQDDEVFPVRVFARTINYQGKTAIMGSVLDLSKEKALELQLIRSQKMESLGQLAGGIAHDFNNILGITAGSLSILQNSAEDGRSRKLTDMAMNAVERGSEIVKRLLLFSRADVVKSIPVSLPIVIDEAMKILEHTLEKNIIVQKTINNPSTVVMGSKEQLLQMILNLGVNARDAMLSGGVLNIRLDQTDDTSLRESFPEVQEGRFCAIHISDNGIGMDDETKKNIFDPFFTTKERDKGTGLGLSIVHGIVQRHNGLIDVQSDKDEGTTFSVYLPLAQVLEKSEMTDLEKEELKGGQEKILIVEDEDSLREILKDVLVPLGYEIIEARDGEEAVHIYEESAPSVDLIILDIGMPKLQGDEVYQKIREIDPEASVLVASGYLEHDIKSKLLSLGVKEFLQKPYSLKEVALTVRKILDSRQKEDLEVPLLA
jgi:signal transduction histidine kinase/ActR/RegA family two-component response regulator